LFFKSTLIGNSLNYWYDDSKTRLKYGLGEQWNSQPT